LMNDKEFRMRRLKELVKEFLAIIGEDPEREGLRETPERVARMWINELMVGYHESPEVYVKKFHIESSEESDEIVVVRHVPVRSICEHHLLPFFGEANIAYIPRHEVLGFSKFARIINIYSKRLQLQERLTNQIADALMEILQPKGLIVMINATHTCALIRGVEEPLYMTTYADRGVFRKDYTLTKKALVLLSSEDVPIKPSPQSHTY